MNKQFWPFVLLMSVGAGLGAIIARVTGTESWLDAKLCIVAGAAIGGLAQHLINAIRPSKNGR